jgi:hypothetical protein
MGATCSENLSPLILWFNNILWIAGLQIMKPFVVQFASVI